jgi:hypothetical protein
MEVWQHILIPAVLIVLLMFFTAGCSRNRTKGRTGGAVETGDIDTNAIDRAGNTVETGEGKNDSDNGDAYDAGGWVQQEFIIGAYDGVRLTGNREEDMKILKTFTDAGFSMMVGTHYWYTSRYFDINAVRHNLNAVSNKYILELMADFNAQYGKEKVRLIANDRDISFSSVPVDKPYSPNRFRKYMELPQELRDCLYGYNLLDEPKLEQLREYLPAISSAKNIEKDKMIYVNLGNTGEDFRTCARELAGNSSMISFDTYHWITGKERKLTKRISGDFFKMAQIMAEEAQSANVPWWGVPLSVEHYKRADDMSVRWGFCLYDPDNRNPKTELARIRFNAHAYIIYGAKGLAWYMYDTSNTPLTNPDRIAPFRDSNIDYSFHDACLDYDGNPSVIYYHVKEVNMKLINMGPVLMSLTWLATVHGTPYNNYEDVPPGSLPVVAGNTPVVASMSRDSTLAVGIFAGNDDNRYLIVMNKDIEYDKTYNINLKNAKEVFRFNNSTKDWEMVKLDDSGSIAVDVETGDIELLKIVEK